MDAVAPGFRTDVDHRIAFAGSAGIKDFFFARQSQRKGVHQGIARVALFKTRLAAQVGNAKTIAIRRNTADYSFQDGMIAVDGALVRAFPGGHRAKPQRIHDCQRTRAHGKDVTQNSANPGGCSLKGLDERRMVVRLDLKGAHPAITDINNPGVFSRALHDPRTARRQAFEMYTR